MSDLRGEIRARLAPARLAPTREAEIVEELAQHLEDQVDDAVARGEPREAAAAAALASLDGNEVLARELGRIEPRAVEPLVAGARPTRLLADVWHDVRYGLRALLKSPAFTVVTLVSLALGIGANTAIFQLIEAIHMRSLPVRAPEELVQINIRDWDWAKGTFTNWHAELTNPMWEELRDRQEGFSGLAVFGDGSFNLAAGGEAHRANGYFVNGDFFNVLGVAPMLGRVFSSADDVRGCPGGIAVVSYGFWQRELGGDPGVIGHQLSLDGRPAQVIGVTPPSFFGPEVGKTFDLAVPLCSDWQVFSGIARLDMRTGWWLSALGRLRPGWTAPRAAAQLDAISPAIMQATLPPSYDTEDGKKYLAYRLTATPAANGLSQLRERYDTPLYFLLATAGLVLVIACANLANLLLARASTREREIAVRLALGASRGRLIRQLMTESLLLAVAGAAAGRGLARLANELLVDFLSDPTHALTLPLDPNLRILGFTVGLAVLTCVIFGLWPAWSAARTDVGLVLKGAGGHGSTSGRERFGVRRFLVGTQVALSFVLVCGALLFVRSFNNLVTVDTGLRVAGVTTVNLDLTPAKLGDRFPAVQREIIDRLRATPGLANVATVTEMPLSGNSWNMHVYPADGAGANDKEGVNSNFTRVSPEFFDAMQLPVVAGRNFTAADDQGAVKVAIVNQAFADAVTHGASPLGFRFHTERASTTGVVELYEVIGLVPSSKFGSLRENLGPIVYVASGQAPEQRPYGGLVIWSPLAQPEVFDAVKRTVAAIAPAATLDFDRLDAMIARTLVPERLMATLSTLFGLLAALVASIGLYGVVAYSVARRTHEIGIRMALGADRRRVSFMVVRESLVLLGAGLAVGLVLSIVAATVVRSLLYGLAPWDPITLAMAAGLMLVVTVVASFLPARRAASVDPMVALRNE
jgi:predicted permease